MSQPVKYKVMDDYFLGINITRPRTNARLNGDTCVRSLLDRKQKHEEPLYVDNHGCLDNLESGELTHFTPGYKEFEDGFDITEDMSMGDIDEASNSNAQSSSNPSRNSNHAAKLLYTPLPLDLNVTSKEKDLLILMAAYYGDIDRYFRLRRRTQLRKELNCIVRDIYHNTLFAKWWSL